VQLGLLLLVELCKHCPANLAQVVRPSLRPALLRPYLYKYVYNT
jgi:hypothetical protein